MTIFTIRTIYRRGQPPIGHVSVIWCSRANASSAKRTLLDALQVSPIITCSARRLAKPSVKGYNAVFTSRIYILPPLFCIVTYFSIDKTAHNALENNSVTRVYVVVYVYAPGARRMRPASSL